LDLPEEHRLIFDRNDLFFRVKEAILQWRQKNGANKLPSFGEAHAWSYTDKNLSLNDIDFTLRLKDVA
jgi:hypothetical protein